MALRIMIIRVLAVAACVFIAPMHSSGQMVNDGAATWVYTTGINLTAGVKVKFETTALSAGSDPVLHLLASDDKEVAVDDNSAGGKAARLSYRPDKTGQYTLVVRSRKQKDAGTCDLLMNGALLGKNVPFGGFHVWLPNLRAGEEIETVRRPGGEGGVHWLYILKSNDLSIEKIVVGGGTESGARYTTSTALGSHWFILSVAQWKSSSEPVRLIRNDAALSGHDTDKDGLGIELEAEIGTCSSRNGFAKNFDCNLAVDPRDTDGDGISDGWELLGRRDVQPHQPLPLWGADPRHKDLFIEVDFMRRCKSDNDNHVVEHMTPEVARHFAKVYGDGFTESPLLKLYHAKVLRNPDDQPGISLHLDTGVNPITPKDATIYGDWGGFTAVNAITTDKADESSCKIDGKYWTGMSANDAWKSQMSPARRGIFRYALGYISGGGQSGAGFAGSFNFHDLSNPPHEWGHTMGLGHSGPMGATEGIDVNCKPNYPSIMNYSYIFNPSIGFSDGVPATAPALNNWSLKEWEAVSTSATTFLDNLEKKFGYYVDREHGHIDWNRDGHFAPAGKTVRAYANFSPGGSGCEYTRYNQIRINDASSMQTPAMARLGNRLYVFFPALGQLRHTYSTSSWNCPEPSIDTPCGYWTSSEATQMNAHGGVDAERIGNGSQERLLIVTIDKNGKLWERRLGVNSQGQEHWTSPTRIPNSSTATGEPALARIDGGAYLAYKGEDGKIRFNHMTLAHGWFGEQLARAPSNAPIRIADYASPAIGRAYLPWKPGIPHLYGAFANEAGQLDIWWFNNANERWEKTDVLETQTGAIEGQPWPGCRLKQMLDFPAVSI